MTSKDTLRSLQSFLQKLDAADFDGDLQAEIDKLSKEELGELAKILLERRGKRRWKPE